MSVFRDEVSFIEIPACTKTNVKVCLTVFWGGEQDWFELLVLMYG